jgi:hypothetical protein
MKNFATSVTIQSGDLRHCVIQIFLGQVHSAAFFLLASEKAQFNASTTRHCDASILIIGPQCKL